MYSEEDLIKEKEKKQEEEKRKRIDKFLGTTNNNKTPREQEQEEEFYDDFFRYEEGHTELDVEQEPDLESKEKKASRGRLVIVVILLLVFAVLGLLYAKTLFSKEDESTEKDPLVNIQEDKIEILEGEEQKIKYSFENFADDPKASFVSSDDNIATVDNEGLVTGIKAGETKIIMSYFIKETSYQKELIVVVKEVVKPEPQKPDPTPTPTPTKDKTKPTLTVSVSNGQENTYVNHDVTINVAASDDSGKVTTQYVFNCSNNCNYQNVSDGKITVSSEGTTVVSIQSIDASGNKASKSVTIKIDKSKPTCSLKVASDGTITANVKDNLGLMDYYGFSSSYTGSKENSKKVTAAGAYSYFVKDSAGNTNTCSITVNTKTQYRSRTCDASHKTFSSWRVRKQVYITSCGKYTKYEAEQAHNTWYRTRSDADASKCNGSSPCYYCTAYIRDITGCNWGDEAWGAYQDSPIESSTTIQVEQSQIFY